MTPKVVRCVDRSCLRHLCQCALVLSLPSPPCARPGGPHMCRFLRCIEEGYRHNPYHNRAHAADVLQTMHVLLHHGGLAPGYADPMGVLSCYLAAVRAARAAAPPLLAVAARQQSLLPMVACFGAGDACVTLPGCTVPWPHTSCRECALVFAIATAHVAMVSMCSPLLAAPRPSPCPAPAPGMFNPAPRSSTTWSTSAAR